MFTDTHAHFDDATTPEVATALMARAKDAGVTRILAVGGSPGMNTAALRVVAAYPGTFRAAVGLDRHMAAGGHDVGSLERLITAAPAGHIVAIGETGLDFHHVPETESEQKRLMLAHLELARSLRLPVIIHTREADDATFELLSEHAGKWGTGCIGVIHCYTGGAEFARRLMGLGFRISFSGIVTFRNAGPLRAVVRDIPDDRLLIETDSPYLAPVPRRGQPNEPAFLPLVAAVLAEERGVSVEAIGCLTSANAAAVFGW